MSKKPSPKREPTPDDPEQYKRFRKTAEEVEADEDAESLSHALKRIAPLAKESSS